MSAIQPEEIIPGIVIHCSPEALQAAGGCYVKVEPGAEACDEHYFLVVEIYPDKQSCLATPLFSEKRDIRDRVLLDERKKSGKPDKWKGMTPYFYKWQFWCIPFVALNLASTNDDSCTEERRFYGRDNAEALRTVTKDLHRLRQTWRSWNSN